MFGDESSKFIKNAEKIVLKINAMEADISKLADSDFPKKTQEFKDKLANSENKKETLNEILPEAFAMVREAQKRTLGIRLYDVQLVGGLALHEGKIAEMKTGEGKTNVAALPLYLNTLDGEGAHLITVNDYLAKRDAHWMGAVYDFLGLSVAAIGHDQSWQYTSEPKAVNSKHEPEEADSSQLTANRLPDEEWPHFKPISRREAYRCDITYGTNNEFGFDYLRDNLVYDKKELSQRGHNFAIVDEVDSILIDEARTPLIISAPAEESTKKYLQFAEIAQKLTPQTDYKVDEKYRSATLTELGISKVERVLGVANLYESDFETIHHIENAIRARSLFLKDKDYVVKDGQVIIVDEFTGRLMPGRRWSEGLHQAVEAKEGVEIQRESRTYATISFQNYFRMYKKLAGMTGTAVTEAEEFNKIYKLEVVVIPTNNPMIRADHPDTIYKTQDAKYTAVANLVEQLHNKGQPVLIGTTAIDKNTNLAIAYAGRGDAYLLTTKPALAQADFEKAISIDPTLAGAHFGLGYIKFDETNYAAAIPHYNNAIELDPKDIKFYMDRGDSYYMLSDYTKAIDDFSKAIELDPSFAKAYVFRGDAKDNLDHSQEAIEDYNKALELNPNYDLAYFGRGAARKNLNDKKGACEDFRKALELGYAEAELYVKDCK